MKYVVLYIYIYTPVIHIAIIYPGEIRIISKKY